MTIRIIRTCDGPGCEERIILNRQPAENVGARVFCRVHRADGCDVWGSSAQWGPVTPWREFGVKRPVEPSTPLPAPRPFRVGRTLALAALAGLPGGFLGYLSWQLAKRWRARS